MILKKLSVISILIALILSFSYADDYSAWDYQMNITLNTLAAGVNEDVSDFPVLIRLNAENFNFNQAQNDGDDIRFSESDGTTDLPYQIERWDTQFQRAEIWVKVDTVNGDNSSQYIIMYWGNSSASEHECQSCVFGSIDYAGVWHLYSMDDATAGPGSDHDGVNHGTEHVPGVIGDAVKFSGDDWIDISPSAFSDISNKITVELWQYGDPLLQPQDDRLVWARDSYGYRALNVIIPWGDEYIVWDAGNNNYYFNRIEKIGAANEYRGKWNHWVFTKDATTGTMRIYLNGSLWFGEESGNTYQINIENDFRLGADNYGDLNYDGRLDEFRVSKTVRSTEWIKLCYENQKEGQELVEFGLSCPPHCEPQSFIPKWPRDAFVNDSMRVDDKIFLWPYNVRFIGVSGFVEQHFIHLYTDDVYYPGQAVSGSYPKEPTFNIKVPIPGSSEFTHFRFDEVGLKTEAKITCGTLEADNIEFSGVVTDTIFSDLIVIGDTSSKYLQLNNESIQIRDIANDATLTFSGRESEIVIYDGYSQTTINPTSIDMGNTLITKDYITTGDLNLEGKLFARKVTVTLDPYPDYVFSKDYSLKPLSEVEKYIKENGHLPGIQKQEEVKEQGVDIGEMQGKLLEKIEEITLYLIEIKNENKALKKEVQELKDQINK